MIGNLAFVGNLAIKSESRGKWVDSAQVLHIWLNVIIYLFLYFQLSAVFTQLEKLTRVLQLIADKVQVTDLDIMVK